MTDLKQPPVVSDPILRLRANIRRRKSIDFAFAQFGKCLVIASLTVLVLLFGQLIRDGFHRLRGSHLVKDNGFAPGIRELVGTLVRGGTNQAPAWTLVRDPYELTIADPEITHDRLTALKDRQVIAAGDISAPGHNLIDLLSIEATTDPVPKRFDRDQVHGRLQQTDDAWIIEPTPLPVDLADSGYDVSAVGEGLVAVKFGLSKSLPLKLKAIDPLVRQGFFSAMPSREAERAGIKSALVGSILVVFVTMLLAVPLGVAAGVWLEEYGKKNWLTALIEINIANLAGVPSIVWGLMALGSLVYFLQLGRSIQTAGITLGLLVLPIVITATREAIRAIPVHIREASFACGASQWQTVRYHILPYSMGGILTGSIIGLSRAIGETAPLITIGALTYIAFLPDFSIAQPFGWLRSGFTVLPIQMFNWISRPDAAFHDNAAAAGVVLLALTLSMNAVAITLRYRFRKNIKW